MGKYLLRVLNVYLYCKNLLIKYKVVSLSYTKYYMHYIDILYWLYRIAKKLILTVWQLVLPLPKLNPSKYSYMFSQTIVCSQFLIYRSLGNIRSR